MIKILQVRLQQYVNHELPDVQAGFRKDRGNRDQIANICWIIEKARDCRVTVAPSSEYDEMFTCYPEKAMAAHSSTLAWKIPWTEEPGGLQSMGSLRLRHN